ncbi:MAG TPA: sugar ABC transporter permease [Anaerolineae bacterium]|nr:sugar ABC transporter permease [Anaerolineae bacterium]
MKQTAPSSFALSRRWRNNGIDFLFILPALLIFATFFAYPVLSSFYLSLTKWNGISPDLKFVGLKNFGRIWNDRHFWSALRHTFKYAFLVTTIQNIIGLVLALAVSNNFFRGFRVLFLIPPLISSIALGSIWKYMYAPNGVLNSMIEAVGLPNLTQDWLGDPNLALYSLVLTTIWKWSGMSMIIYLAGLQAIPKMIQEAASIDGVSVWQRFRFITFPLIAPAFTINIVLSMIGSLKVFDIIYLMTQGGPGRVTESLTTYIFGRAFEANKFGYATAVAVVMFVIILVLSLIQLRYLTRREVRG